MACSFKHYTEEVVFRDGRDGVAGVVGSKAVCFIIELTPPPISMLATVGFGVLCACVAYYGGQFHVMRMAVVLMREVAE